MTGRTTIGAFAKSNQIRAWVILLVVLMALGEPARAALHAAAPTQETGFTGCPGGMPAIAPDGTGVCVYPPHPLLNLEESVFGATAEQAASLKKLSDQAVANVIKDRGLTDADHDAVQTWARYEALAELYLLLVNAIDAKTRTTDQQNVVDWLAEIMKAKTIAGAHNAGREYVKWAGLNSIAFETLLNSNPTESQLKEFLNDNPQPHGFCAYTAPSPYSSDYSASTHLACLPCLNPFGCPITPPTPSYDEFVKWGEAGSSFEFLDTPEFKRTAHNIGAAFGLAVSVASAISLGTIPAAILVGTTALATSEVTGAVIGTALSPFTGTLTAASAFLGVAAIVIVAIIVAVTVGMQVISASELPGKLAELIADAPNTVPDATTLTSTSDGATMLFTILIGASLPEPEHRSCDNSNLGVPPPGVVIEAGILIYKGSPCLNPTPIPVPTATDTHFEVWRSGLTILSPTIGYRDAATGEPTTAWLSKNWFITERNGSKKQTLSIQYLDWDGKPHSVSVLGNPTGGYKFVTFSGTGDSTTSIDVETCVEKQLCSASDSIKYWGSDGWERIATLKPYVAATGTPIASAAVEGSPVKFDANGVAPPGATGAITYEWLFQKDGCGPTPCATTTREGTITVFHPVYGDPVDGASVTHTWRQHGTFSVELRATDAIGTLARKTFEVVVENVPPKLDLVRDCRPPAAFGGVPDTNCEPRTVRVGTAMRLAGSFDDASDLATLTVEVGWGDGAFSWNRVPNTSNVPLDPVTISRSDAGDKYVFEVSHTYAAPGTYYATVTVSDGNTAETFFKVAGMDEETAVIRVEGLAQTIEFPGVAGTHTYGEAPIGLAANGGASGQPVSFSVTGAGSVCAISTTSGGPTVTLLKAGTCTITASQAGGGQYEAAQNVTQSFAIQPAALTVIPGSGSMSYDGTVPRIGHFYVGYVNGDDQRAINKLATCSSNAPSDGAVGTYTSTCSGAEDDSYTFIYEPGSFTIRKADTKVTASPVSPVAVKGQPLTVVAMVDVVFGGGNPTGTVEFRDGATPIAECAAVPLTSFVAACTTTALGVGTRTVAAAYSGDSNFKGSSSAASVTVNKASTGTTVTPSVSPSSVTKPVTFTAAVAVVAPGSGAPTGPVTFFDGATRLGIGQLAVVGGKVQATFSTSGLALGRHSITASYGGNSDFTSSISTVLTHNVNTDLSLFPKLANGAYNLTSVNLKNAWLVGADLTGAVVRDSNFTDANLTSAFLIGATLNGTFRNANFTGANLDGARFTNANLAGAKGLNTATLTNVVWTNTVCPNGKNSSQTGGSCIGQW